jgi:hypothetical protein
LHYLKVFVKPDEVLLKVTALHGRIGNGHVDPQVKDATLALLACFRISYLVLKGLLKVQFNIPHDFLLSHKVAVVPLLIGCWTFLFVVRPVLEKLVEEFDGEHFYLFQRLELWDVHMRSLGDVQKDSIHKVQEELELQVLTPRQAQIEEELTKPLEFNEVRLVTLLVTKLSGIRILLLVLFSFNIDLPVFKRTVLSTLQIKIQYQRLLDAHI